MNCVIDPAYSQLTSFVSDLRKTFPESGTVIYSGRNTLKRFEVKGIPLVVKAFKIPNPVNRLAYVWLRQSKAARSYTYAQRLKAMGIGTPDPVGYVEHRRAAQLFESYYVSLDWCEALEIRTVFKDPVFPERAKILQQFARFAFNLHEKNILHVDFSAGNILLRKESNGYAFSLVDLNRMRFRQLTATARMNSLAKLGAGEADTRTVAEAYAGIAGLTPGWCVRMLLSARSAHLTWLDVKKRLRAPFR